MRVQGGMVFGAELMLWLCWKVVILCGCGGQSDVFWGGCGCGSGAESEQSDIEAVAIIAMWLTCWL